jgi:hypothetical protein
MEGVLSFFSGAIGGLIAAFTAISNNQTNAQLEHITFERKKWRDDIRNFSSQFIEITFDKLNQSNNNQIVDNLTIKQRILLNDIYTRINPTDPADQSIITLMNNIIENRGDINLLTFNFSHEISRLLKHDWERSKLEVKPNKYLIYILIIPFGIMAFNSVQFLVLNQEKLFIYILYVLAFLFSYHILRFVVKAIDENKHIGTILRRILNINSPR